jgi:hypothetical protein
MIAASLNSFDELDTTKEKKKKKREKETRREA